MCSISGFNFKDENLIQKMNASTKHRGPDGSGVFVDDNISLGHNRLSIIDPSPASNQPFFSNDGRYVIVFNGEIYNYADIKREIKDYDFKSAGDTEVIIAAYKKWGSACVKKFDGIFSFAIWDKQKEELFLARDHIGLKPLYYYENNGRFVFSSEIKAILEYNAVPRVLNRQAFSRYMRTLYVPEPLTMFDGIYKFPSGSFALYKNGRLMIERYWDEAENRNINTASKHKLKGEVKKVISQSIESQLISDKPLGVSLSGGIDSSCVLYNIKSLRGNIDTFSVGYELENVEARERFNRDFELARRTAKYYGSRHNEIMVGLKDFIDYFEKSIWHLDEPISNPTTVPMMVLAKFAKKKVDVLLSGDGGDELFGGYHRYQYSYYCSLYRKMPKLVREILNRSERLKKLDAKKGIDRIALFTFQKDKELVRAINNDFIDLGDLAGFFEEKFFSEDTKRPFEQQFMDFERKTWIKDDSLMRTDKMFMSAGVEVRVPLLGKDVVEFATGIPLKHKLNLFDKKIILKQAFRDDLPDYLFKQPKMGWISPGAKWIRDKKVNPMVREILSPNFYPETKDMFKWDGISKMIDGHCGGGEYNLTILWSLLTFQAWAKRFGVKIN